jgi:excisionase family DNA binding protein
MSDEGPFTTGDVARLLHVSLVTVLLWIRAGKLKGYRVPGGHYRIAQAEFRKFLTDNQIPVSLDAPAPRRVLVVDDEASVREAFAATLRPEGSRWPWPGMGGRHSRA